MKGPWSEFISRQKNTQFTTFVKGKQSKKQNKVGGVRYSKILCEILVAIVFGHEIQIFIP